MTEDQAGLVFFSPVILFLASSSDMGASLFMLIFSVHGRKQI